MRMLIIGGTIFLGRHLVEAAMARGHTVTLFNRGQHNPDLFPEVEKLRGNRDGGLDPLRGRQWDAVMDTCGAFPRIVRASAELLADAVGQYIFISTMSVYADLSAPRIDEDSPVGTIPDGTVEQVTGETYGPLKALCEQAVEAAMPGRTLNIRPGLIVGPHDPSNRFTYWVHRVAQGGTVLAPGTPDQPVQFIVDVRDLAAWIVQMAEHGRTGVFNAKGPDYSLTMGDLLATCKAVSGSDARFVWVSEEFLLGQQVGPWMELPLWLPATMNAINSARSDKAYAAALTFRPLSATVRDTLAWDATLPPDAERRAGLARDRETHLLATWQTYVNEGRAS
ncbi:MAG: SDR family oxidoreductase [Thermomicrobiales bacterium]